MGTNENIAIVTGVSHTQGIGAAICRKLAKSGSHIFFTYFEAEADWPSKFEKELKDKYKVNCDKIEIDLSHSKAAVKFLI